ncbi:glycosyltransferase family 4 protein [Cetobacterium sp.]|uniref:glycosyltransferase family 4 protein n=1 Tax=Cetobacterium sp. TaxID=2071632 RepID=UPI003F2DB3D5
MKVLIYNTTPLRNAGGPSGYLYNLKKYLKNKKEVDFFINEEIEEEIKKNKYLIKIKKLLKSSSFIREKLLLRVIKKNNILKTETEYDIINFHSTLSFYQVRKNNINSLKVLMSHSPQPTYEEFIEDYNLNKRKINKENLDNIKEMDYFSFKNTDYIIFPCKEAMEPYLTRDKKIETILQEKLSKNKVKFLPTGIVDKKVEFRENYFYEKFGIPKSAIVLSYIGRHNEIKGYDLLVKAGKELLDRNKEIYIIVAGQINPNIAPLKHERWIELGWTLEGDNIMKHAHAYLLPNRETYFDLVFIEALRAGTTIICSETGGNKYFKQFNSLEIVYFERENIKSFIEIVEANLNRFKEVDYIKNRKENRKIYNENFTIEKFGENYLKIMEEIYEENK